MFRAGDVVKHLPTGEEWLLACDEEFGEIICCGWPETMAKASDCVLVKAATDALRHVILEQVSRQRDTLRGRRAKRQLEAPLTAEMRLGANLQALFPERKLDFDPKNLSELINKHVGTHMLIDEKDPGVVRDVKFSGPLSVSRVGEFGISVGGNYRVERTWYVNPRSKGMMADEGYVFEL